MLDIIKALYALKNTPIPNILVVAGIAFIFFAFVGSMGANIQIDPSSKKGSVIVGVVMLFVGLGLYLVPPSTGTAATTDKIAGTWTGVTNWNDYQGLQNTISIKSGCVAGDICGITRMDSQYWCAGDLVLSKIEGEIFTFIQTNQKGNVPDNGCENGAVETIYLLAPDKLSWGVSRSTGNNPGTGSGTLLKQP